MFIARKANIPRLHIHLCRHTFATNYLVGGGDSLTMSWADPTKAMRTQTTRGLRVTMPLFVQWDKVTSGGGVIGGVEKKGFLRRGMGEIIPSNPKKTGSSA
jgi:hypothetical protein